MTPAFQAAQPPEKLNGGISFAEYTAFEEAAPKQPQALRNNPGSSSARKAKSRNLNDGYVWKRTSFQMSQNLIAECTAFEEAVPKQPKALTAPEHTAISATNGCQ
jgi:hypothetical protein